AEVTMLSGSSKKKEDAKRLAAHEFLLTSEQSAVQKAAGRFDFILDTVSAKHDLATYLGLLKREGTLVMVGASPEPIPLPVFGLIFGRKRAKDHCRVAHWRYHRDAGDARLLQSPRAGRGRGSD
ncbi:MAG: zinc-binding dehydrogenase, partial [Myxococcaceae bacterium]